MTIDSPEYRKIRDNHISRVVRESCVFMMWYDRAAKAVFEGMLKTKVIDTLAPYGCDTTQANGVVAGTLQAVALLKEAEDARTEETEQKG